MRRVALDSNVYISALVFQGRPMELLDLANLGKIKIVVSDAILDEVTRILASGKFQWAPERIDEARELIVEIADHVTPAITIDAVKNDPADNRILECAVSGNSDYLVSGDQDLLRLKQFGGIPIMRVSDFLNNELGLGEKAL